MYSHREKQDSFISNLYVRMLAGYDYIVLGLLLLSVLVVVLWGKSGLTHIILGSYLLIILALGLYRSIDTLIVRLQSTPDQTGLFMLSHRSLANFFANGKLWIISLVVAFLGWQMVYGSSLGALTNGGMLYRIRQAIQIILAVIAIWILGMVVWAGPAFFTTGLATWSQNIFSDPLVRQVVSWLPGILTGHLLLTILATTVFSAFIDISFRIGRSRRERDAIYVERDEVVRHVVE